MLDLIIVYFIWEEEEEMEEGRPNMVLCFVWYLCVCVCVCGCVLWCVTSLTGSSTSQISGHHVSLPQ